MRNSRKQSHHFEFSVLLMGWVIWERQCGSKAKEPTGIQRAKIWISVTAAGLVSPGRQLPSPGTQILPMHTGLNATKPSLRDVKPGLPHVVVQTVHCTRMPAAEASGGKMQPKLAHWSVHPGDEPVCLEEGALFPHLHEDTIWASGGPVWMKQGDNDRTQSLAHWMDTFTQHNYWTPTMCQALF